MIKPYSRRIKLAIRSQRGVNFLSPHPLFLILNDIEQVAKNSGNYSFLAVGITIMVFNLFSFITHRCFTKQYEHLHTYLTRIYQLSFLCTFPSVRGLQRKCCYDNEGELTAGPLSEIRNPSKSIFALFQEDILPYVKCCMFSDNCFKYQDVVASGSQYIPPNIGN